MASFHSRAPALFYLMILLVHFTNHWRSGLSDNLFWLCDLSAALACFACLSRKPRLLSLSYLWLLPGSLFWLLDSLMANQPFSVLSALMHLGGLLIASLYLRNWGWRTIPLLVRLIWPMISFVLARIFTSAEHNVNLAFAFPKEWRIIAHEPIPNYTGLAILLLLWSIFGDALAKKIFMRVPTKAYPIEPAP